MANEYVYAEGTGFIVRQHYNPNTGAWIKNIDEWGNVTGTYNTSFTTINVSFPISYQKAAKVLANLTGGNSSAFINLTLEGITNTSFSFTTISGGTSAFIANWRSFSA